MKTAVSIPDVVFRRAERLAKRLKKSRSQLYSEALADYVSRHDPAAITAALDELYGTENSQPDRLVSDAAQRVLRSTEW
jgi:metal-responsive CopG/Arc/MetJ family transcriptional regulator